MKRIGMLTIGQSPRTDILPTLTEILGGGCCWLVSAGCLFGGWLTAAWKNVVFFWVGFSWIMAPVECGANLVTC